MTPHPSSSRPCGPRGHRAVPSRSQAGFTLVELVTVILILGVLAAVALPRYADLQGKARAAKVQGVAGAIRAASAMVKASAMTNGVNCGTAAVTSANNSGVITGVSLEGTLIDLNYCYAQTGNSLANGILAAANVASADGWVIDSSNVGGTTGGSVIQVNLSDAAIPGSCSISYTSSVNASTAPTITAATSGC